MEQPEALRLADALNSVAATKIWFTEGGQAVEMQHIFGFKDAITELRRLQALNAELLEALVSIVNSAAANQAAVLYPLLDDAREAIAKAEAQK